MGTAEFMFGLEHRTVGSSLFLLLSGELDIWAEEELAPRALQLIDTVRPEVVVDLQRVTFLDASGLRLLLGIRRCVKDRRGTVHLVRAHGQPRRVLRMTGVERVFDLRDGEPDGRPGHGPARSA